MSDTVIGHLRECLAEVEFPASRNQLLDAATRQGDPTAVQALRSIPRADYASLPDVLRAVRSVDSGATD